MVLKLTIEYDGTNFYGWQIQPSLRTVQGELKKAIRQIIGHDHSRLIGASRTDTGVHALAQVASLHLEENLRMDISKFQHVLNNLLPRDIYIKTIEPTADSFHARFSAKSKVYKYTIFQGRAPSLRHWVWEYLFPLELEVLKQCAKLLLGVHDFSSLAKGNLKEGGEVRIIKAEWQKLGDELYFIIEADRFLWKMVRIIVALMVRIARGKENLAILEGALHEGRRPPIFLAPAQGLTLLEIKY